MILLACPITWGPARVTSAVNCNRWYIHGGGVYIGTLPCASYCVTVIPVLRSQMKGYARSHFLVPVAVS